MDNDEKILALLENMKADISEVKSNLTRMQADISELRQDVDFTQGLVVKMENVDFPGLRLSLEGFITHDDQIRDHERRISKLETA